MSHERAFEDLYSGQPVEVRRDAMPTYSFRCQNCGHRLSQAMPYDQSLSLQPCPACGDSQAKKIPDFGGLLGQATATSQQTRDSARAALDSGAEPGGYTGPAAIMAENSHDISVSGCVSNMPFVFNNSSGTVASSTFYGERAVVSKQFGSRIAGQYTQETSARCLIDQQSHLR